MRLRYRIYYHLLLALAFVTGGLLQANAADYAAESVLAQGKWVKIEIEESGIYQLTRSTLAGWGFGDINAVKIYGYGGAMISEVMGEGIGYTDDLPQVRVLREKDKIIFYAQGPVDWKQSGSSYIQQQNPYSTKAYYFITDREDLPSLPMEETGSNAGNGKNITDFPARLYHELEKVAPATTGRTLLGEDFKFKQTQSFKFELPDIVPSSTVSVTTRFMAATSGTSRLSVTTKDGSKVSESNIMSTSGSYAIGRTVTSKGNIAGYSSEILDLDLAFKPSGSVSFANLDYITVNYRRQLKMLDKSMDFRSTSARCTDSTFVVSNFTESQKIWDVTVPYAPKSVKFGMSGSNAQFRQTESGIREYIAFNPSSIFPSPKKAENVANQNLHGKETPTMLIITPNAFRSEAERLAELHRTTDGFKVEVVTDEAVYNEFSSGTPDVMAYRKIAKMWWDRSADKDEYSTERFRYLLLFGRSVFDNRRLSSAVSTVKYPTLLTWESYDCDSESSSLNADDVFGYLVDGSDASRYTAREMCIGIGRLPVKDATEAAEMVDKIYRYATSDNTGDWRTNVMMIADDGDTGSHMKWMEKAVSSLGSNGGGDYVVKRIYLDAYNQESSGAGHSYPDAKNEMLRRFREGVIYAAYLGHANPYSWTHNELLRWQDIENEFYYRNYPLLYTGTCEFTRWDAPSVSGGELLLLNPDGGTIAMITSSRVTGIDSNGRYADCLSRYVFSPLTNGEMPRLGDIMKRSKNDKEYSQYADHSMRYVLLGDPALRLKYPEGGVQVTSINDQTPDPDNMPEIKARENVVFKGYVTDKSGKKLDDFSGLLSVSVYDAEQSVSTHGNGDNGTEGAVVTYQEHTNRLYLGTDSVKNGEFQLSFKMPSAIVNNYTPAMISLYAQSDNYDAIGKNEQFYVYGIDESASDDVTGPEIRTMYLNNAGFKDGDTVNETPFLVASFYDESGINLSSIDIGHNIVLTIDGRTSITGMESFYSQDTEKVGHLNYQLDELAPGSHTMRLRLWDVLGNMSEKTISFNVEKGQRPQLFRIYTTANPAKTSADFYIEHNRPDALLNVRLTVYNMLGQSVWTAEKKGRSDMFTSSPITWDLTDGSGRRVTRGIYLYRAEVWTDGGEASAITQRIAVAGE